MNGALTIGTLDGANVEIRDAVGHENFFLFGLEAHEVAQRMRDGYHPHQVLAKDPGLAEILDDVAQGRLSPNDPGLFRPLIDDLLGRDPYLVLADFRAYVECQERVAATYADPAKWTRMAILNVARVGSFSSDRSITEYADKIWEVPRVKIP
jgi:starch phosphorylase